MNIEIIEEPIRFCLNGFGGVVENERYGEVGLRLMNEMWQMVKRAGISTTGINHWVYLPDKKMFVGVDSETHSQFQLPNALSHSSSSCSGTSSMFTSGPIRHCLKSGKI